ncbi:hypothetical protein JCM8202_001605 [Rhodotorula sphaerocarpa]
MLRAAVQTVRAAPVSHRLPPCTCGGARPSLLVVGHRAISTSPRLLRPASTQAQALVDALPKPASKYTLPRGLELKGTVVAAGRMAQTVSVEVERRMTDHKTLKEFSRHTKFLVHDPEQTCVVGDQVLIRNCRPISARKRYELVEVTKGARERLESHHGAKGNASPAAPSA